MANSISVAPICRARSRSSWIASRAPWSVSAMRSVSSTSRWAVDALIRAYCPNSAQAALLWEEPPHGSLILSAALPITASRSSFGIRQLGDDNPGMDEYLNAIRRLEQRCLMLECAVAALTKLCTDPAGVADVVDGMSQVLAIDEPESAGPHLTELLRLIRIAQRPPTVSS